MDVLPNVATLFHFLISLLDNRKLTKADTEQLTPKYELGKINPDKLSNTLILVNLIKSNICCYNMQQKLVNRKIFF